MVFAHKIRNSFSGCTRFLFRLRFAFSAEKVEIGGSQQNANRFCAHECDRNRTELKGRRGMKKTWKEHDSCWRPGNTLAAIIHSNRTGYPGKQTRHRYNHPRQDATCSTVIRGCATYRSCTALYPNNDPMVPSVAARKFCFATDMLAS